MPVLTATAPRVAVLKAELIELQVTRKAIDDAIYVTIVTIAKLGFAESRTARLDTLNRMVAAS
ncbi:MULTISPECIES: hypothetical protein [unclassified Cryobacterium]|uniref:hypothetical protein n=1 Tax=unclassified Cryobacterium TaxID=2649013 RepID=UPI002B2272C8|nr:MULTISPECIES: hypothetical protein [Cryobacterium]MEB0303868.1 hypothetical protein [Cryobacterium sp. 10I1]MEC5148743.1 hypothetical protein [Cryobacterium psychrotolerans]